MRALRVSLLFTAIALIAEVVPVGVANAWSTLECSAYPGYREQFPEEVPWPLVFRDNMPDGHWSQADVMEAMDRWNGIYGAFDVLASDGGGYQSCFPEEDAGIGIVGWDNGTCFDWWPGTTGVSIRWERDCVLTRSVIYFNAGISWGTGDLASTAAHELGHYLHYEHNWFELSIMGYTWADTPPMSFLSAHDHAYLRAVFPSGYVAPPDLHVHRFRQVFDPEPDALSYEYGPDVSCSPHCGALQPGDSLIVPISFGNAGAQANFGGALDVILRAASGTGHTIANYVVNAPAHSEGEADLEVELPPGIPGGTYHVEVSIAATQEPFESDGPSSAGNVVRFGQVTVVGGGSAPSGPPPGWTCEPTFYGTLDGCDCDCGIVDPDCAAPAQDLYNCGGGSECTEAACVAGRCAYPPADGRACDDDDACTQDDACLGGTCGGLAVSCTGLDDACNEGMCEPWSGECVAIAKIDGTVCDDGAYCTTSDRCSAGMCAGQARDCAGFDDACNEGRCNESLDRCEAAPANEGAACDDGFACRVDDVCRAGSCVAGSERNCSELTTSCAQGVCDEGHGGCLSIPRPAGTWCGSEGGCRDGAIAAPDVCDGQGGCQAGTVTACTPYLECGSATECASGCTLAADCVEGFNCRNMGCQPNEAPVADPGPPQLVEVGDQVTLDAGRSWDPDADALEFAWEQRSGPRVILDDDDTSTPTFVTANMHAGMTIEFALVVSDGAVESEPVSTAVVVAQPLNEPPTAIAVGPTSGRSGEVITLDASSSFDRDGDVLTYTWSQAAGPQAFGLVPSLELTDVSLPEVSIATELSFVLVVRDMDANSAPDEVRVTVFPREDTTTSGGSDETTPALDAGCSGAPAEPGLLASLLILSLLWRSHRRRSTG